MAISSDPQTAATIKRMMNSRIFVVSSVSQLGVSQLWGSSSPTPAMPIFGNFGHPALTPAFFDNATREEQPLWPFVTDHHLKPEERFGMAFIPLIVRNRCMVSSPNKSWNVYRPLASNASAVGTFSALAGAFSGFQTHGRFGLKPRPASGLREARQ
jgi:hypothetical protein